MKVVLTFIFRKLVIYSVNGKSTALDAVCRTADDGTVAGAGSQIPLDRVKTEHDIVEFSFLIKYFQCMDRRTVFNDGETLPIRACNNEFSYVFTVFCRVEKHFFRSHISHL